MAACKNLLFGRQKFSINARTAKQTIKVDVFKIITKKDWWILMQINFLIEAIEAMKQLINNCRDSFILV